MEGVFRKNPTIPGVLLQSLEKKGRIELMPSMSCKFKPELCSICTYFRPGKSSLSMNMKNRHEGAVENVLSEWGKAVG